MYKLLFGLLTEPLGLPIEWYWELVGLAIINEIAFQLAWKASPGGKYGSVIHWIVRAFSFVIIWALARGVISVVKWISANWIFAMIISISFILLITCIILLIKKHKQKRRKLI